MLQSSTPCARRARQYDVAALDVNDPAAVDALITRMARDFGPVRGIVHAAVLLEDGMISGLQPDRLRAVLSTKLKGAENLAAAQPRSSRLISSSSIPRPRP